MCNCKQSTVLHRTVDSHIISQSQLSTRYNPIATLDRCGHADVIERTRVLADSHTLEICHDQRVWSQLTATPSQAPQSCSAGVQNVIVNAKHLHPWV